MLLLVSWLVYVDIGAVVLVHRYVVVVVCVFFYYCYVIVVVTVWCCGVRGIILLLCFNCDVVCRDVVGVVVGGVVVHAVDCVCVYVVIGVV